MGKLIIMLKKIRDMNDNDLFERFIHIVRAQAVREYLGTKEDKTLKLEITLSKEEIYKRMAIRDTKVIKIIDN